MIRNKDITMTTYYTLDNRQIPETNIVKTYKKGTCDYQHTVICDRCHGRGVVHVYGVCYKCNGACKVVKKSKGYTADQLKIVIDHNEKQRLAIQQKEKVNNQAKEDRKALEKKAMHLQLLITIGGNSSDFASSLASSIWALLTTNHARSLSDKQMTFVYKFLQQGCTIKNQPYDKVKTYLDSKL
jgi:DnaJ-class molecular chaperone